MKDQSACWGEFQAPRTHSITYKKNNKTRHMPASHSDGEQLPRFQKLTPALVLSFVKCADGPHAVWAYRRWTTARVHGCCLLQGPRCLPRSWGHQRTENRGGKALRFTQSVTQTGRSQEKTPEGGAGEAAWWRGGSPNPDGSLSRGKLPQGRKQQSCPTTGQTSLELFVKHLLAQIPVREECILTTGKQGRRASQWRL